MWNPQIGSTLEYIYRRLHIPQTYSKEEREKYKDSKHMVRINNFLVDVVDRDLHYRDMHKHMACSNHLFMDVVDEYFLHYFSICARSFVKTIVKT